MKILLTLTSAIAAVLLVGGIVNASAADWLGTSSPNWNDLLNWQGSLVPDAVGCAIQMVGNGSTTFTATITNDVAGRPAEILIGGYGATGRIDHRAGTLSTTNPGWPPGWVLIGWGSDGNGTYNLADTTTTGGTLTGYGIGSGTLNIVDGLYMGDPGGGDGNGIATLNVNTTGALNMNYDFSLGVSGWNATVNLDAGAIYSTNGWIRISKGANNNTNSTTSGTLNQAGGSVDSHWGIQVGGDPGSTSYTNLVGTVNLNGGTMTTHGPDFWDGGVWIGASGTGTFNLNGGTLSTLHVLHEGVSNGPSIFNFNGGTLKAQGAYNVPWGAFFGGFPDNSDGRSFTAAYVQAGGAIIDTAGFDNYIGQALLTGTNITDGGLTKNGNGQLEIGNTNTFTGPVVVNGGTLYANSGGAPNNRCFSFCSGITVNSNATLLASSDSLFGWDNSQAEPITVNVGGTATAKNGEQIVGLVTLAGGTLASVSPDSFLGSWHFRASDKKLLVTSNSTVTATYVAFTAGATIEVASGMTLNFTGFIGDGGYDGPSAVIKQGAGTLVLDGANTYTGNTTINAGTLAGTGTIPGILNNNAILAPGDGGTGALTINGNITLASGSTNTFTVNGTTLANSSVIAGGAVTYGGVLNIVPSGSFTAGQTFTLFSGAGATSASSFASISGNPGSGLAFSFTNGVLSVVTTGPSGPATITNSISGSTLTMTWPAGQGWKLQMQTNSLTQGLGTNWVYISDGSISSTNITINPAKPTVFYRLVYP